MRVLARVSLGALAALAAATTTYATTYEFIANQGSANATAQILVNDASVPDKIEVTVNVVPTPYGDILGIFFNLTPFPITGFTSASIAGDNISTIAVSATGNTINSVGCGGNNLNGEVPFNFDVGLEIDGCGAGAGLLMSTTFTIDQTYGATVLTAASFENFGIRLQAVGDSIAGTGNEGSAKLYSLGGVCVDCGNDDPVTPEPSTWALLGGGLAAIAWLRRKKSA